jgi:hypothetical protein
VEKSSKLLPEIITLVPSANKIGSNKVFIVGGSSFIYIMKSKGPKIDPWETPLVEETFHIRQSPAETNHLLLIFPFQN